MDVTLTVTEADASDDQIATRTRALLKDIREDADPHARLVTKDAGEGARGDAVSIGQIALALVSGGAITSFIRSMFGYLGRHRKIEIEVQNTARKKLKLKWDYVDSHGEDKALALVTSFLKADK
jgi:hypothetical protein